MYTCVIYAVVRPGKPAWRKIVSSFGEDVLESSGEINRAALGAIIFNDTKKRSILNQCTHPYIQRTMLKQALWHFLRGSARLCEKHVYLLIMCATSWRISITHSAKQSPLSLFQDPPFVASSQ